MALPRTSLPDMITATQELEKSARVAVLPFSDDSDGSWSHGVYPIAFLEASASAEEKRRALLTEPTSAHADAYHAALLALFDSYDAALAHDIAALDVGKKTTIQSFGGTTSSGYIMSVLERGRQGLIAMRKEENRRYSCAEGNVLECAHWRYWPPSGASSPSAQNTLPASTDLPSDVAYIKTAARAFTARLGVTLTDTTTVALSHSRCYPSFTPAYVDVGTHASILSGVTAEYFTILNDSFFYDLKKIPVRYSKAYYNTGATYSNQSFNAYICQDFGQDVGLLLSIQDARETLQQHPIVPLMPSNSSTVHDMLAAQNELISEDVPREQSYRAFIQSAERLLTTTDQRTLPAMLGAEQLETLRNLVLASRTGSAHFERVVGYFDDLSLGTYVTGTYDPYRTSVFFMLRGGISSLFMIGNETGPFPPGTSLFESRSTVELAPTGYTLLSYKRDLQSAYALSTLLALDARAHTEVFAPLTARLLELRK